MKARALTVPRAEGETVRRRLLDRGWLRTDLAIRRTDAAVVLPLRDEAAVPSDWGPVSSEEFPPYAGRGPADYRDLLASRGFDREILPRSFDVVGDVVVIRLPPELEDRRSDIGAALLEFVPHARVVGWDRGVHGESRLRRIERIAGAGDFATRHHENGLEIAVDLARAYFSPRLAREHARVAADVQPGDRVYDLCCGVGPFSLAIARDGHAASIVAVDANAEAIRLLEASARGVPHGDRIRAEVARVEAFARGRAPAERVILNLPLEGIKYAPSVANLVAPRGRLYYYEVVRREEVARRPTMILEALAPTGAWSVGPVHVVHPYAPDSDLVAMAFDRREA